MKRIKLDRMLGHATAAALAVGVATCLTTDNPRASAAMAAVAAVKDVFAFLSLPTDLPPVPMPPRKESLP